MSSQMHQDNICKSKDWCSFQVLIDFRYEGILNVLYSQSNKN